MNKDINNFEYFEEMTDDWNRTDLLRRCYDLCNEKIEMQGEIERLHSIIKEVREYINNNIDGGCGDPFYEGIDFAVSKVLQILDKVDKEK